MIGTAGTAIVITSFVMRVPGGTRTAAIPVRRTLMLTVPGATFRTTAMFGIRTILPIGFRIAAATGFGNPITDGPGWDMSLGAGRHITTGAGCMPAARGDGGPDRSMPDITRSGHQHTF